MKRKALSLFFYFYLLALVFSGAAFLFEKNELLRWPFNHIWNLFQTNTKYNYEYQVYALKKAEWKKLDVSNWYAFPIGAHSNRFNELPKNRVIMAAAAMNFCKLLDGEYSQIKITQGTWFKNRGKRVGFDDPMASNKKEKVLIHSFPCRLYRPGMKRQEATQQLRKFLLEKRDA